VSDVLDILIVGGGPFGTAVAFRARELELNALVIDYDDLMKRIRDYAKDKQILPDYGGGDQMQFPRGGKLISRLPFGPIDKDDLCAAWKGLYTEFDVPARIGLEFTGLEQKGDAWDAVAWDHNERREARFTARHVVLAMGRGVPRQIEVMGDPQGLAFSLKDAARYVGAPACVIGGGTSAAEAVTAISAAKAAAGDASAVFWSYRGDKMPKVSRALAEVFFDAFMGNGNIRYLPKSDPITVTGTGADAMLAIRTSRVQAPDTPTECTQLEFFVRQVIACIGEDIPTALLAKIGTPLVSGGPSNKTRIGVTPLLETQQPNVYLAGDTLSPVYFEVGEVDDPGNYREVRRRGNIKAALRDGVFLAEVIAQKLSGRTEIRVSLEFEPSSPVAVGDQLTPSGAIPAIAGATDATVPMPAAAKPAAAGPAARRGTLVAVLPSGTETHEYTIATPGTTSIGRHGTDIAFPDDALLSERHATIVADAQGYFARDDDSSRGTYVQIAPGHLCPVSRGTLVKVGNEWLRVGDKSNAATLTHLAADGSIHGRHALKDGPTIVGRQSPDVSLATTDQRLSRRHCVFVRKGESVSVRDLASANGTIS
jgi:pSer/pThr/pTyr-binding forkhead associated (FHA) protein/thioredoxin reductase